MGVDNKNIEQRMNALSESKAKLLEKLLTEQKKKKRESFQDRAGAIQIPKREKELESLPCSYMQKKFWYVEQMNKNSIVYNISGYVHFKGKLDTACLKEALSEVIKREEAVRSCFVERNGSLVVQLKDMDMDAVYKEINCTEHEYSEAEREEMMIAEGRIPFDLGKGELIRLVCYKFSETDWNGQIIMHHIVSDGYSSGVIIKELLSIYEQLVEKRYQRTAIPEIQYYDYVIHENKQLSDNKYQDKLNYWVESLSGSVMKCEIPSDFQVDNVVTYQGDRVLFRIDQELKEKIETLAKKNNVTNFCILMSALKILLHKYVSQDDIIVGTPVMGRNSQECQELVGCFINMLPIRSVIDKEEKVIDFIKSENSNILNGLKNQEVPFDYIVEQMKVEKDIYSSPIYQIVFSYEANAIRDIRVKDLEIEFSELNLQTAKVDLALEVNDNENGYEAWFEYKSNKFGRERIEKIVQYYMILLEKIVSANNEKISELEMITDYEKNLVLHTFNSKTSETYVPRTISAIFEEVASENPYKKAIVFKEESITYNELNERANQLASYLLKKGVTKETIVAVMLEKSIDAIVAFLGITKAGGVYLPLDLTYPQDRLSYILEDSQTAYIIMDDSNNLVFEKAEFIHIKDGSIYAESKENVVVDTEVGQTAYIIYTSGTTGKPKGVMVGHTGIQNLKDYMMDVLKVTKEDVVLQFANLVFDASIWEFTMGLLTGATLCIVTKDMVLDETLFMQTLEEKKVTVATLPPQFWTMIQDKKPDLRILITAGSEAKQNMLKDLNDNTIYFNAYGPTETTVCATAWEYDRSRTLQDPIPIGIPVINMQIYIMNQNNLCGIESVGELCVAGVGVAKGYLNNAALTNEKFVDNPYGEGKIYRTGDYASWTKDGNIIFHGRIDTQVKINGYRVEIGEIETAILSMEQVQDAVVTVCTEENGSKSLVSYIIAPDSLKANDIRDNLMEKLPHYMIPANYYRVSSFPLNINGKVDFSKLVQMGEKMVFQYEYVEASSDAEKLLSEIWRECMSLEKVSVTDNFFEIGGDSIICMQIISKAAEKGIKLELKSFYDDKNIREMAKNAKMLDGATYEQGEITGDMSLTPIQKWFIGHNYEQAEYWNQSVELKVKEMQVPQLNHALNEVLRQHDILRAQLLKEQNAWKLSIPAFSEKQIVTAQKVADQNEENEAIIALQKSVDIYGGDAFKALLLDTKDGMKLVLTAHHLICDAVSYRYIVEDVFDFYASLIREKEIHYPMKSNSFIHWERELSNYMKEERTLSRIKWWKSHKWNQLQKLPRDRANESNLEQDAVTISHTFLEEETERLLKDVPQNYSISIKELLIACLGIVLKEWDQKTHAIYMESYGRDVLTEQMNNTRTVGWFTQVYPFLMEINDDDSLNDTFRKCKDVLAEVEKHKAEYLMYSDSESEFGYEMEKESLLFNYLGQLDNAVDESSDFMIISGKDLFPRGENNHRPFLIDVNAYISGGQLHIDICYSSKIYEETTIRNLLSNYVGKISDSVVYCIETEESSLSASDFSDVDLEDLDYILSKFND